jgi:hypothetical protein
MPGKEINFQLAGIEILEVNLKHPEVALPVPRKYNFETKIKTSLNLAQKQFHVIPDVEVIYDEDKSTHASIKVNFTFEIDNFTDFIAGEGFDFPDQFIVTMVSISISTLRGIMYSQFRGTFLNNTILPIIDPKSFLKKTEA